MKITFMAFHGSHHPRTRALLDKTMAWYAVPGVGVATKEDIAAHCLRQGIWPSFAL